MKKFLLAIAVVVLSLGLLTACGSEPEELSQDDQFLDTLTRALEARWELVVDDTLRFEGERQRLTTLIDAELEILAEYRGTPETERLEELRGLYMDGLNKQMESLQYYDVDFSRYLDLFDLASGIRASALVAMVDEFNLELDEENLQDIRVQARLYDERQELQAGIDQIMESVDFQVSETSDWSETYESVVKNVTDVEFSHFSIEITLIDAAGVAVGTNFAMASNWSPGQSTRFDFTVFDEDFETMELSYTYSVDN